MTPPAAPLSILHVVRQFLPNRGGLEDFVANLAREQARLGHRVRVLTLDRLFSAPEARLPAREVLEGIAIERIPFFGSSRYPVAPSAFRHLGDADLVHVHAIDFFFDAFALAKPLHRRPMVATTHGGFFHTSAHSRLKKLWFEGPTRMSVRAYEAIVACSESDAKLFDGIVPGGVEVVQNGVDLDKFAGAASPEPRRALLTIGRFAHNKRLDRLLATMRALNADGPAWRLRIVGVPSDVTAEALAAEIDRMGLSGAVTLHTGLDAPAVRALIGESSLFVSASQYEGFGIALIEALSAGLVPVAHPNDAFAWLAQRHPLIGLADFAAPETAAEAIRTAHARLERGEIARGCEDLSDYRWSSVASRYVAVYEAALAGAGHGAAARAA
ncbi:glycosyltransferase family 4 protein [Methylobacterium platani]|uniref:Glycosyl transferase family 1 n=2 Tax=Methylobacterium platani TaxID=427683 RepID=A0A179SFF4_9HYPH|nr:glycosyltransferase family 4 protein [Methylobacterium platani]KMO17297.1 glycosyl transferase family 1 [Methylobacterium platani JCM 14648]OAS25603.1 glycosyl transferase family 1 [Methylobacterium platani]